MAPLNELGRKNREKSIVRAGGIPKYIENIRKIVLAEKHLHGEAKMQENLRMVDQMERSLIESFPHLINI